MDLARDAVNAVLLAGRSVRQERRVGILSAAWALVGISPCTAVDSRGSRGSRETPSDECDAVRNVESG